MKIARPVIFILVVAISAVVYYFTLCPTVEFIDSGELALSCKNLGVAHPTGYPLYTILGRITALLSWGELIISLNILSLLFASFAAGFLYLILEQILVSWGRIQSSLSRLIAASSALFMAFSPVWWSQGTTNEVYSLNLLLISISLWALFWWITDSRHRASWLILATYILGLCFTNHLSVVYLLPAYIYAVLTQIGGIKKNRKRLLAAIAFFIFPATLYLLLPIRANFRPFLNWGGVNDFYFFYKHITGWQYQVWMFDRPISVLAGNLAGAAKLYYEQFGWFGIAFVLVGAVTEALWRRTIFIFAILVIALNLFYVINYEIADIEPYYLPMFLLSAIFLASGLQFIIELVTRTSGGIKYIKYALIAVLIILPVSNFIENFYKADRSRKTFARQGVIDMAQSMAPDGLAIVENWDFYSPWLYLRFQDGYRPDAILLDKELMRRSWYIDFIRRYHPQVYRRSQPYFEEFLRDVRPFERGEPFDPQIIDQAYYGMLHAVIKYESEIAPVYTNILDDNKFINGFMLIPDGTLFRFDNASQFVERPWAEFDSSYWGNRFVYRDIRVGYLLSYYARAFDSRQKYCTYFGHFDEAAHYAKLYGDVKSIMDDIENRER